MHSDQSSFIKSYLTILGFTTATGVPICCVIIMACMEMEAKHIMELQPWTIIEGEDLIKNMEANSNGTKKYFPHGPACFYNGKDVPCYVTCSEHR